MAGFAFAAEDSRGGGNLRAKQFVTHLKNHMIFHRFLSKIFHPIQKTTKKHPIVFFRDVLGLFLGVHR